MGAVCWLYMISLLYLGIYDALLPRQAPIFPPGHYLANKFVLSIVSLVQPGDLPAQEAKGKLKLSKEITQKQKVSPESVSLAQDADDTLADKDTDPTAHWILAATTPKIADLTASRIRHIRCSHSKLKCTLSKTCKIFITVTLYRNICLRK